MRAEQISKYFVDNEIQVSLWKEYSNTNMERRKVRMNPAMLDWGHRLHTHKHTHTYTCMHTCVHRPTCVRGSLNMDMNCWPALHVFPLDWGAEIPVDRYERSEPVSCPVNVPSTYSHSQELIFLDHACWFFSLFVFYLSSDNSVTRKCWKKEMPGYQKQGWWEMKMTWRVSLTSALSPFLLFCSSGSHRCQHGKNTHPCFTV